MSLHEVLSQVVDGKRLSLEDSVDDDGWKRASKIKL